MGASLQYRLVEHAEHMQQNNDDDRHASHPQDQIAEHGRLLFTWVAGAARRIRTVLVLNGPDGVRLS
jgi:hypothetical protein